MMERFLVDRRINGNQGKTTTIQGPSAFLVSQPHLHLPGCCRFTASLCVNGSAPSPHEASTPLQH